MLQSSTIFTAGSRMVNTLATPPSAPLFAATPGANCHSISTPPIETLVGFDFNPKTIIFSTLTSPIDSLNCPGCPKGTTSTPSATSFPSFNAA
ncbi:hypothetical protein FRC20_002798 [Serendipita sp. 405]|nr:hypothetical protein FRC20_002798 [Serendipita sp. 405]